MENMEDIEELNETVSYFLVKFAWKQYELFKFNQVKTRLYNCFVDCKGERAINEIGEEKSEVCTVCFFSCSFLYK
jgi:hypothetical protein